MSRFYSSLNEMNMPFEGGKIALYLGSKLVVILRDMDETIPFPGHWDLPGGGREGDETPVECVLRETEEELGLKIPVDALAWGRAYLERDRRHWFFVGRLPEIAVKQIRFGNEGQGWQLMRDQTFIDHPRAIPHLQSRLLQFLQSGQS
ncbi:NUDIX hydrolase [Sulfitobacter sp. LCG007]